MRVANVDRQVVGRNKHARHRLAKLRIAFGNITQLRPVMVVKVFNDRSTNTKGRRRLSQLFEKGLVVPRMCEVDRQRIPPE